MQTEQVLNPTDNAIFKAQSTKHKLKFHERVDWVNAIPFLLFHIVGIVGVFLVPFSWSMVGLCLVSYVVRIFGITGGYHRYFAHKTYKQNRFMQFLMAFLGGSSHQKGALWWAAHHRHHHKYSDQPDDTHSPVQEGFWWAHMGWILVRENDATKWEYIKDLSKFPELRFLNKNHWIPGVTFAVALLIFGGPAALMWGYFLSTVLVWHGTFAINSLSHVYGSRRYETTDDSRNNPILGLILLGEGWHNNHHTYQNSTRQGFYWWEIDLTYYALIVLRALGLVHGMKEPPLEILEAKRIKK